MKYFYLCCKRHIFTHVCIYKGREKLGSAYITLMTSERDYRKNRLGSRWLLLSIFLYLLGFYKL